MTYRSEINVQFYHCPSFRNAIGSYISKPPLPEQTVELMRQRNGGEEKKTSLLSMINNQDFMIHEKNESNGRDLHISSDALESRFYSEDFLKLRTANPPTGSNPVLVRLPFGHLLAIPRSTSAGIELWRRD